jgi:hypothetical protein
VKQALKAEFPQLVFTCPDRLRALQPPPEQLDVITGLFAQPPVARLSVSRPIAENLFTGADPGVSGFATPALDPPADLACAARLLI